MEPESLPFISLLDALDIGIFILDAEGYYLYVNRSHCELAQKPREFFVGTSIPMLKKQGYLTDSVWEQVIAEKKMVSAVVTITDKQRNRIYDALTIGRPWFDEDGNLKYIFYTQESLPNLNARLQRGMMNKSTIIQLDTSSASSTPVGIIAESPQMKQLMALVGTVSKTDASVLVSGPSGSGKEVIAHYIHRTSQRSQQPFVVLNCAAIPESLMESELFGYEKWAFTGAAPNGKVGLLEAANGGTLFLDEINSMPPSLQTKLLRVLETQQVTRVGSVAAQKIDFRLICASNENLHALVSEKRFRADLLYRINVISIQIPPLRERKEDIIPLTLHYLQYYCKKYSCVKVLAEQVLEKMNTYDWPGNVRELKNFVERLIVTSPPSEWLIEAIPSVVLNDAAPAPVPTPARPAPPHTPRISFGTDPEFSYTAYMESCECDLLTQALQELHSPAAVAKALKMDLSTVYRKMQKYHLGKH